MKLYHILSSSVFLHSITNHQLRDLATKVQRLVPQVEQVIDQLPWGVVHSDLHEMNVLWKSSENRESPEIAGVLDWDDCFFGPLLLDVVFVVYCWTLKQSRFDKELFETFLKEYTAQRSLTELEKLWFWKILLIVAAMDTTFMLLEGMKNNESPVANLSV